MDPLDAGTDNGFTFTAPNWQTDPQGIIYRITSKYPGHPAGSFFYPNSKRLPPIATFQFIKVSFFFSYFLYHDCVACVQMCMTPENPKEFTQSKE